MIGRRRNWVGLSPATSPPPSRIADCAPGNPAESAIIATLPPGSYTAIAQGVNGGTGVGLVEVFVLP